MTAIREGEIAMTDQQAYRLSRIQAEGWKAARTLPAKGEPPLAAADAAARNPYKTDPERARWREGFESAI